MEIHTQHCYTNELSSKILKKKRREIFKPELSINRLAMAGMLNNNIIESSVRKAHNYSKI